MTSGTVVAATGLAVVVGWWARGAPPAWAGAWGQAVHLDTALVATLCGAGLVLLAAGRRAPAGGCAGLAFAVAGLRVAEYVTGSALDPDRRLLGRALGLPLLGEGRMPPNSALFLLVASGALAVATVRPRVEVRAPAVGTLSFLVLAGGAVSLLGYASGVEAAYRWGHFARMDPPTAAGLVVLAAGLFAFAWHEETAARGGARWLAPALGLGILAIATFLWQALQVQERTQLGRALAAQAADASDEARTAVETRLLGLGRKARNWEIHGPPRQAAWEAEMGLFAADNGFESLLRVDPELRVGWGVAPRRGVAPAAGTVLEEPDRLAPESARRRREATLGATLRDAAGRAFVRAYVPLIAGGRFDGFLVGVLPIARLLAPIADAKASSGHGLALLEGGAEIYVAPGAGPRHRAAWGREAPVDVAGGRWRVLVWPLPAQMALVRSRLPEVTLAMGILTACLLALTVHLAQTARRRAEKSEIANRELERQIVERRRADERFRLVVEGAPNGIVVVNQAGDITFVNSETERLFGYRREELLGQSVDVLVPEAARARHALDRSAFLAAPDQRLMGAGRDVSGRHRDGREVPIAISLSPLATADGTVVLGAITDITELRLAQERLRALNETLEQRVAERTALAERRARELAESNAQLARSNRDLDDFAYIASHDLKEPLRGIVNYATFLMEDHGGALASDARERLETIMRLSGRLGSLIDGLLQFSRVGRLDLAVGEADLNALVREAAEALQGTLEEQRAEVRVPAPLPTVRCDRLRTRELFYNLISNAVKYNDKPRKWVEIGVAERPPEGTGTNGDRAAPTVFYVRDNGIGIPRKHQEAIFRIFKRLHGREKFGGGTGAGLTIAQKIVERHGGRIWCESTEGEGATFYFTLEGGENAGAHEAAAPDPGGRG